MLPSALAVLWLASAAVAATGDPMKLAADWKSVVMTAARSGGLKDAKACSDCLGSLSSFAGCQNVTVPSTPPPTCSASPEATSCSVVMVNNDDKIVEAMRKDKKCSAAAADPAVIKKTSEDWGTDVTPGLIQCGRCVTPDDVAKWPELKRSLMQLLNRFNEAEGKTDAASRTEALKPLFVEAGKLFVCYGEKIEPTSCALIR